MLWTSSLLTANPEESGAVFVEQVPVANSIDIVRYISPAIFAAETNQQCSANALSTLCRHTRQQIIWEGFPMSENCSRSSRTSAVPQQISVPISLGGEDFVIPVFEQRIDLGPDVPITYYWIDTRLLRGSPRESSEQLCQTIIHHWRQAMLVQGSWDEDARLDNFLLASCHPAFSEIEASKRSTLMPI